MSATSVDRLSVRDRNLTLAGVLLALFLGALDQTIVSTALPSIVADLQGLDRYSWVASSYLLASTAFVPIYGRLADAWSRKDIELWAVGLFLGGSMLCGLAGEFGEIPLLGGGMGQLIAFRALQGIGGAGVFAMAFIVIADLFPPAQRGRYQGLVGAAFGIASILGPVLGGLLTDRAGAWIPGVAGWRWIFYVNLPFGAIALWFIVRRMPPLPPRAGAGRLDLTGALLLIAGVVPLVLGLQIDKVRWPWWPGVGSALTAADWQAWATPGLLGLGVAFFAILAARVRRVEHPIVDPSLFANVVFRRANVAAFSFGAAFLTILIFLPLFMVHVVGVSATGAGIAIMPLSLGVVVGSTLAGQLAARFERVRGLMLGAILILLCGMLALAGISEQTPYALITLIMVLCGVGIGPSFPLFTLAIQNAVDVRQLGQATSAVQFFRQMGGTMGVAFMGAVLTFSLAHQLGAGMPGVGLGELGAAGVGADGAAAGAQRDAFAASLTLLFRLALGFVVVGAWATWRLPDLPLRRTHDVEGATLEPPGAI